MARIKLGLFLSLWISVIITGVILARWQMERLSWKTAWLSKIDRAYTQPIGLFDINNLDLPCTSHDRTFFTRMSGTLTYTPDDAGRTVIVKPRVVDGMFGFYVFNRATLENGAKIWVNRGFVKNGVSVPPPPKTVQAVFQIRGTDMKIEQILSDNPLVTINDFREKPECAPLAVMGVIETVTPKTAWPQPVGTRPRPANDHLNYAIFWFTMSIIAAIMGGIILFRKEHLKGYNS